MPFWVQMLLSLAAFALLVALVAAVWALRGVTQRAEAVLAIVEQELRPLIGQMHGLADELRDLTRETRRDVVRIGEVTEHVETAAEGMSRIVVALGGLARAGQLVGLAAGLRRGVDVFVSRLRRDGGDNGK